MSDANEFRKHRCDALRAFNRRSICPCLDTHHAVATKHRPPSCYLKRHGVLHDQDTTLYRYCCQAPCLWAISTVFPAAPPRAASRSLATAAVLPRRTLTRHVLPERPRSQRREQIRRSSLLVERNLDVESRD